MDTRVENFSWMWWLHRGSTLASHVVHAMRPKQWIKNAVCLAPLIFSGKFLDLGSILAACLGTLLFSFLASAIYITNDLYDVELDRQHPKKRHRPIASGALPLGLAAITAGVLAVSAIGVSLLSLGIDYALVLGSYAMLNVLYSAKLKHIAIVDVIVIALGFLLRVNAGAVAIDLLPSEWLLLCMFFLALLLGFAKRRGEMVGVQSGKSDQRPVLSFYSLPFIDLVLGITATLTLITYALYVTLAHTSQVFIVTLIPVTFAILRYLQLVLVNELGDKPEEVLLADLPIVVAVVMWALLSALFIAHQVWVKGCTPPC